MAQVHVKEITVNSGEVKFSNQPAMFTSMGIGSCVVLFIYEPWKKIGGVAHIMLPGDDKSHLTAKRALFANTAPSYLVSRLVECGAAPSDLKAKIVGGGNMFDWADAEGFRDLGKANVEQVKRELIKNKIYLAAEESGGDYGKTVKCCTSTGHVYIKNENVQQKVI
jgi:chemotaxis protein CheD